MQTLIEAFSYQYFQYKYPRDGKFNFHEVVTIRQEALTLACFKIGVIEKRQEEMDLKDKKEVKVHTEDWPSRVYKLSLKLVDLVKADRDFLRSLPKSDMYLDYFSQITEVKFSEC